LGWDGSLTIITNEIDKINYSSDQNWESNKKNKKLFLKVSLLES
jgi:hypothetical protein